MLSLLVCLLKGGFLASRSGFKRADGIPKFGQLH
jgi:hypothetical protein